MSHPQNSPRRRDDRFLTREDDGSVRLRLRFARDVASLIEEAAEEKPPVKWIEETVEREARRQVRENRAKKSRLSELPPPREAPPPKKPKKPI